MKTIRDMLVDLNKSGVARSIGWSRPRQELPNDNQEETISSKSTKKDKILDKPMKRRNHKDGKRKCD